ncbi:MAG: fluoride efflux transporter CrcB [Proteobacteria bacterium]|nr:fluoride efflux transporter CrcB [Pseudomonadota bacterium]MBU1648963.1 fluoride efflux transporter CrcB [Pseudomonadota bacterium]MBU1986394.1 fluoride efflux transporter CrcB [Pseudomonadota bacterium]
MQVVLLIAGCGALGCVARYLVSGWVYDLLGRSLPYGTFVVNILGAFLIGLVMDLGMRSTLLPVSLRTGITIGFLGGFTTFSTFSYETFRLLEEGDFVVASANVLVSVTVCLLFTWLGMLTARLL